MPTRGHHHVGFMVPGEDGSNSVEGDSRQMNSKREFQIRKSSKSKLRADRGRKGNKSPSEFTYVGAKSVVSMFTTHSGKSTFSAPAMHGGEDSASESN
jgi:hypothetical protein